jgi:osmoprotectant transport system permease protein
MTIWTHWIWPWISNSRHWHGSDGVPARLVEHLAYSGLALLIAVLIALPIGLAIGHRRRGAFTVVSVATAGRAVPTLGLLILVYLLSNAASWAWLIPLAALAIPPILVNTYEGVLGVDADITDAARGMGMTGTQVLLRAEFPVALPLILVGVRTAAIQVVATATIAAYISLGGFGRYIFDGLATNDYAMVAGGALLVVVLALAVQMLFVGLRRVLVPAGLRTRATGS